MNIGIDLYEANVNQRVGIGQFAHHVISELYRLEKHNFILFSPRDPLPDLPKARTNWRYVVGKPGSFWTVRQLPGLIKKENVDVFFSPTHYLPWFTSVPKVMAIMDVSYLRYPELFQARDLLQLKLMTNYSVQRARKILTISEFSKQEIIEHYKYPKDNIEVTYPGINRKIKDKIITLDDNYQNKILKTHGIDRRYLLFVGTLQPRKNLERLIAAFERLKSEVQLIIVGKKGWLWKPIIKRIQKSPKRERIKLLDFVSEEELFCLYNAADCFVLPSLYEGFGIPVVEAMFMGCPVVVSNTSSLPEIAGDAGIYVNPQEVSSIATGITNALQLKPTERRNLIQKGYRQAAQFSWETCARKTLSVLESIGED